MTTLYGIKQCDTVKKARKWLDAHQATHQFHDFRIDGLDETLIQTFLKQFDVAELVNKRSTTWRQLSEAQQQQAMSQQQTIPLLIANPTLIKRPILKNGPNWLIGFQPADYEKLFG